MVLAFSLTSELKTVGAYAGLAAVVGLALLALLYFAQAREVRRLLDWTEQQEERIRSLSAAAAVSRTGIPPSPSPAPQAGATVTTAVPGVRRVAVGNAGPAAGASTPAGVPAATVAGALASAPANVPPSSDPAPPDAPTRAPLSSPAAAIALAAGPAATAEALGVAQRAGADAPAGDGPRDELTPDTAETEPAGPLPDAASGALAPGVVVAPSVGGSATSAKPFAQAPSPAAQATPGPVAPVVPAPPRDLAAKPVARPAPAGAAAQPPAASPPEEPPPLAPSTAAGARPRFPPAPGDERAPPVGAAPRVSGLVVGAAALGAGSAATTRRRGQERAPEPRPAEDDDDGLRPSGSTLRLVGAAIAIVVVLIFVATRVLGGSGTPASSTPSSTSSQTTRAAGPRPSSVRVAVLNGTRTTGLAAGASTTLVHAGFRKGAVADAPVHNQTTTTVGYTAGNRAAALEVAGNLSLSTSQVQPVDAASAAVANAHGARPKVVVVLGSDYAQR